MIVLQAGYAYFTRQPFGAANDVTMEHRWHQDLGLKSKIKNRFELKHRIRIEERFVKGQDFRTRYRYTLFLKCALLP